MVSASVRRQQIAYVCQRGRSVRRACALLSVARSTVGYESKLAQRDAPAVAVMKELASQYPRYGYRRIQVFMGRRGGRSRSSTSGVSTTRFDLTRVSGS
jgi:putative transposase